MPDKNTQHGVDRISHLPRSEVTYQNFMLTLDKSFWGNCYILECVMQFYYSARVCSYWSGLRYNAGTRNTLSSLQSVKGRILIGHGLSCDRWYSFVSLSTICGTKFGGKSVSTSGHNGSDDGLAGMFCKNRLCVA